MGSRYLAVMAQHAADDPFEKVKRMIKDLIIRLMEEANAEADHHAFCSTELATNKQTRDNKAAEVEKLTASVDKMTAEIGELATEITQLSDAIAEISAQQSEGMKLRAEEKSANEQVLADAKGAQEAVEKAIQLLRDFYGKQEAAASMIQQAQREPYTGMGDTSTGVLGLLDVILSDFARLETETSAAEDQAVSAFEKFMAESTQDKEVKEMELSHKQDRKQSAEEQLRTDQKELKLTQEELDKALDYYDKLKEDCLETGLSYEDRVRMRQEEIQSLKEALRILNGEDIA
jgi:vacuolar-type H+-ATPase subunit I/STV1